jgi:hypothetical protein
MALPGHPHWDEGPPTVRSPRGSTPMCSRLIRCAPALHRRYLESLGQARDLEHPKDIGSGGHEAQVPSGRLATLQPGDKHAQTRGVEKGHLGEIDDERGSAPGPAAWSTPPSKMGEVWMSTSPATRTTGVGPPESVGAPTVTLNSRSATVLVPLILGRPATSVVGGLRICVSALRVPDGTILTSTPQGFRFRPIFVARAASRHRVLAPSRSTGASPSLPWVFHAMGRNRADRR